MKRIICSIGFLFAIFFLTSGFFLSYQISSLCDRMNKLEQESALTGKQVSASLFSKDKDYIFEKINDNTGALELERYRVSSYAENQVVLRKESIQNEGLDSEITYEIRMENGCLVVYLRKSNEVFEYTDIPFEVLPAGEQAEVLAGKEITGTDALYSFLENYSS